MKKVLLLVTLVAVSLSSCKKDLTEVTFSTNLSKTSDQIVVNAPTSKATASNFNTTFVLDLDNADTHNYLDQIKDVDLDDVRITFQGLAGLAGNQVPTNFTITINNQITFDFPNFTYDSVAQGDPIMITDNAKIQRVANLLKTAKKITIKIESYIPDTNMYEFNIKFMAKAKITANAL